MSTRPDILLAHGHYLCADPAEQRIMKPHTPLGLLMLSAFLKWEGFRVELFDSTFAVPEDFERALDDLKPLAVGISVNLGTKFQALRMLRQARDRGVVTILGGPEPAEYAQEYLDSGADCVVIGEGERTLAELLQWLRAAGSRPRDRWFGSGPNGNGLARIAGLAFADDSGRVVRTTARTPVDNLSDLPWPDREAVRIERYLSAWRDHHGYASLSLICARGCPFRCTWCSHSVFGRTHRRRTVADVADEVEHLRNRYNPEALWFADDVFNIDHKWLYAFRDEMARRQLPLPFECLCRADRMDERVADALATLKCTRVWLGAESGSQKILDAMKRDVKIEQVHRAARVARRAGLEVGTFVMLGYDGEQVEDIKATIEHLREMAPDVMLTTSAYPVKGTEYYNTVAERIIVDVPWQLRTDRDLRVIGEHSPAFFELAKRWVNNEIELQRLRGGLARRPLHAARVYLGARWYRRQTQRHARVARLPRRDWSGAAVPNTGAAVPPRRADTRVGHGVSGGPFDRLAPDYDERFTNTALGRWLRRRVWDLTAETLRPGGTALELNGGTGEDACWLAQRGMDVTYTDGAPRMVELAARKVTRRSLQARVKLELLDLNGPLPRSRLTGPYDAVLSNFGGLNCVADRRAVAAWLARRTNRGASVILVVMGPFCPWEVAAFAVTRPELCLRRWHRDGVLFAHDADDSLRVHYPSPAQLGAEFAPWFERTRLTGLGILLPPTPWQSVLARRPGLFAVLGRIERAVAGRWPATWLNDHYMLELRRR